MRVGLCRQRLVEPIVRGHQQAGQRLSMRALKGLEEKVPQSYSLLGFGDHRDGRAGFHNVPSVNCVDGVPIEQLLLLLA